MDEYSSLDTAHAAIHKENIMEHGVTDKIENIFKPHMGGHDGMGFGGGGFGSGLVGGILGGALFGGRRGGLFGNDGGDGGGVNNIQATVNGNAILEGISDIKAAVPLAQAQTENAICNQTNALNGSLASLALGSQQGFSNVKDSVQANSALNLAATGLVKDSVQNSTSLLLQAICSSTKEITNQAQAFQTANDSRLINAQAAEIIELRNEHRRSADNAELRLQITNTNTAVAAQQQGQLQQQQQQQFQLLNSLVPTVNALIGDIQAVKQGQVVFNSGTMLGSATQAAANTRVA